MTPERKAALRRETAVRLRKPFTDSIEWLGKCRAALHSLDPKQPANWRPRALLFQSAGLWVVEARMHKFALEAAMPDTENERSRLKQSLNVLHIPKELRSA